MLSAYLQQIPDCFNPTYSGKPVQPCWGVVVTMIGGNRDKTHIG